MSFLVVEPENLKFHYVQTKTKTKEKKGFISKMTKADRRLVELL